MFKSVKLVDDRQYVDDISNINLKFADLIDFGIEQQKFQFTNGRHILDNNKWQQIYEKLESFKTKQQPNISMNPSESLFQVLRSSSIEDLDIIQNELISIYRQANNNKDTRDLSLLAKATLIPTLRDQILFPNITSMIKNSHQLNSFDIERRLEPIISKYEVSYAEYIKRLRVDPSDDPLSVAQTDLQANDEFPDKYQTITKSYNIETNKRQQQVLVSTNSNVGKISKQATAKFFLLSNLYCLRELLLANIANSSSSSSLSWPYVNQKSIERKSKLSSQIDEVIRYSDMERMRSYNFKVSISVDFEDNSYENFGSRDQDNKQSVSYSIDSNQQAFDRYPEVSLTLNINISKINIETR